MREQSQQSFFASKRNQELIVLLMLFLFSMAVRRIGVEHGFPLLTHPDEAAILHPVFNMTRFRTLNPAFFDRPNQILYLLNFIYLNIISYLKFGTSLANTFVDHQVTFHYYARLLISVFGSLVPVVAYKIGKELKPNLALPAGLVFAVFPLYAQHSLYITPDIPITLFTLLVIYLSLCYLKRGDEKYIYLAVFFAAVNTAEKYPGLISLAIVFLAVLINFSENPQFLTRKEIWHFIKKIFLLSIIFLVFLFLVAPYLFIEFEMVRAALVHETRTTHLGADNLGWGGNLLFYVQTFFQWSNILAVILMGIGVYALVKWQDKHALILWYGMLYWVILSRLSLHWERWALPMYITPLFLIAVGITYGFDLTKRHPKIRVLAIIVILFFVQQAIATLHTTVRMRFVDTRVIAAAYCDQNGITQENTIFEGYTPLLPQEPKNISQDDFTADPAADYIILSSFMYERFYNEPERHHEKISFYEQIKADHVLINTIEPNPPAENIFEKIDDILFFLQWRLNLVTEDRSRGPTILIFEIAR